MSASSAYKKKTLIPNYNSILIIYRRNRKRAYLNGILPSRVRPRYPDHLHDDGPVFLPTPVRRRTTRHTATADNTSRTRKTAIPKHAFNSYAKQRRKVRKSHIEYGDDRNPEELTNHCCCRFTRMFFNTIVQL